MGSYAESLPDKGGPSWCILTEYSNPDKDVKIKFKHDNPTTSAATGAQVQMDGKKADVKYISPEPILR